MLRPSFFIVIAVICASLPLTVLAQESEEREKQAYSDQFTGAFQEYSIRGAWSDGPATAYEGWSLDAGFRHSFPMLLGDTRLSYRFDSLRPEDQDLPAKLERHAVGVHVAFHPLYLALLGSDWLGYTIASLYFEIGGGAHYGILDARQTRGEYERDFGLFASLGAGIDFPLWDPDVGFAPWLNAVYRFQYSDFDRPDDDSLVLRRHEFFVGLGWRINGLLF
ncbi:MAG: hypothetical protein ACQEVA_08005 [Myxococcota bacterium]